MRDGGRGVRVYVRTEKPRGEIKRPGREAQPYVDQHQPKEPVGLANKYDFSFS